VEKLVYVLWRKAGASPADFQQAMLGPVKEALLQAGTRGLEIDLADKDVAYAQGRRLTRLTPTLDGVVSFWLDVSDDRQKHEAALQDAAQRLAGYLVTESTPLRNTTHTAPLGERTPGANLVGLLERPASLSLEEWIHIWHHDHRSVAHETQCTYEYLRHLVVRPLCADAPPWAGIVFEGFPSDAVTDPMKWYLGDGDPKKRDANLARMIASCQRFLELDRVESHPMSQYVIQERL